MVDFTRYLHPAIRIEAWDSDSTQYTLMDTIDGSSTKNYTISASISKHINDRIGSFSLKISNKNGQFLNTFSGGEDIEIYVDYDTSIDENLNDNLTHFYNFDTGYKNSVGNSYFVNNYKLFLPFLAGTSDASGAGNDATNYNAVLTANRLLDAQEAYDFDGSTAYMTHTTTDFEKDKGTLFIWFKPDDVTTHQVLYDAGVSSIVRVGINTSSKIYCQIGDSGEMVGDTTLVIGSWYCVIVAYDLNGINLYLNGYEDATEITTATMPSTLASTHYIGTNSTRLNYFNGVIDEVLYLNSKKDGDNLFDMYLSYVTGDLTSSANNAFTRIIKTEAYYSFDGNVLDSSANARHASLNTDLVAHYKMNDNGYTNTIIDSKGMYYGQAVREAQIISTTGKINDGLVFNGTSDYVSLNGFGTNMLYHFTGTTNMIVNHHSNDKYPYFTVYGTAGEIIEPETVVMDNVNQFTITTGTVAPAYIRVYKEKNLEDSQDSYDYLHSQTTATSAWSVAHNLNDSYPCVMCYDSNSSVVEPFDVTMTDANNFVVNMGESTTGYVRVITNGTASKYLHTQSTSSTAWTITHSLGDSYPFVEAFDSSGNVIKAEKITVTNSNNIAVELGVSTTGYVRVVSNDYDNLATSLDSSDFLFTSWINPTGTTSNGAVMSVSNSSNVHKLTVGVSSTGYPYIKDDSDTYNASTRVDDGNWHHLGLEFTDVTGAYDLYVDNVSEVSSTYNFSVSSTDKISFGQEYTSAGTTSNFYDGLMDDTRFYDETLLDTERTRIYNTGSGTEDENLDGPQLAINRFNESSKCYDFDGKKDYVADVTGFPILTDDCVFLAWVRDNEADTGIILGNKWYFYSDVNGQIRLYDGSTIHPASTFTSLYTGGASTGWHQVGFMLDSGVLYYIQDGVKSSSIATGVSLEWSGSGLGIGNDSSITNNFNGRIDEVVIVDDVITDNLINDFYNYTVVHDWSEPFVSGVQNHSFDCAGLKDQVSTSITINDTDGAMSVWLKNAHTGENGSYVFVSDAHGGTYIKVNSDNNVDVIVNGVTLVSGMVLLDGIFNHVVINWKTDAGDFVRVYLNNIAQIDWTSTTLSAGTYVVLGGLSVAGSEFAGGIFDKFVLYDDVLTDNDIAGLYSSGKGVIYEDMDLRGQLVFKGKIDNAYYGVNQSEGFYITLSGRDYPQMIDRTITGTHAAATVDVSVCGILDDYFSDVKLAFWTGTSWAIATYNSTLKTVSWSLSTPTFPTTLINYAYEHKKAWTVIKEILERGDLEFYMYYDRDDTQWYLRVFVPETYYQYKDNIRYSENLISMNEYGRDTTELVNKVITYGKQESDNIIILKTEEDSTSQSDMWIKDKVVMDESLTTMSEVQDKTDFDLAEGLNIPANGRMTVVGLSRVLPGAMISSYVPYTGISGRYKIQSFTHNIAGNTFKTNVELTKKIRTVEDIFIEKANPDDFITGFSNPNDMTDSYSVYFNESPSIMVHSGSGEVSGKLQIIGTQTSAMVYATYMATDRPVRYCELRRYESYNIVNDTYHVTNDGGISWEAVSTVYGTMHAFATAGGTVSFKINMSRTSSAANSSQYESVAMVYKA